LLCLLLGALVGGAIALRTLEPAFITGTGGKWVRPENDYVAYLVAWNYYIVDEWRWPLFDLPAMGYPEGGSVLFNDALPLASLPTKLLYKAAGVRLNPFGWWIFLTYVLQGAMAARMMCAVGVRSVWASAAAAVLAVVNTSFASRMGHTALSSHFLLLWALAMHFESLRRGRARVWEYTLLLAVAILVNSYLFAMVFAFQAATFFALWLRRQLPLRDVGMAVAGMAGVALIGIAAGYGVFLASPSTMKSQGFGLYSWNLVGLLVPPNGLFGYFAGIARDGTHGQYEGESWVGMGAFLVLALSLVLVPRQILPALRRYWVYVATLVAFAVYAASNIVYAGSVLVVHYPLPQLAIDLGNYFRATGRFIWPLAYSLMILPLALVFRTRTAWIAIPVAMLAVYVQLDEGLHGMAWRRVLTTQAYEDLIDTPRVDSWLRQHRVLFQYPSWACGGLGGSKRSWGNRESNRELQVQLAAARAGIPTNSVYTSRMLKHCPTEFTWVRDPQAPPHLEDGVLYLLSPETVAASPALIALARTNACVTLEWGIFCSRMWELIAASTPASAPAK
jgi:hypothetical protein